VSSLERSKTLSQHFLLFYAWCVHSVQISLLHKSNTDETQTPKQLMDNHCIWSPYLRAAYNNAYRIMHYMPRNVSVRPHQVSHCVRTFDAVLRNNLYRFFIRWTETIHGQLLHLVSIQVCWIVEENWRFVKSIRHLKRSNKKLDEDVHPGVIILSFSTFNNDIFFHRKKFVRSEKSFCTYVVVFS